MTSEEEIKIGTFNENLPGAIGIDLVLTDDSRSEEFGRFCEAFSKIATNVAISETRMAEGLPEIGIAGSLRYRAVPAGPELDPFLEALAAAFGTPPAGMKKYAGIETEAELSLFVSPQCVFCPGAVRKLFPLAILNAPVRLTVIDGFLFNELSESEGITSAPTLILNGDFRWTGDFQMDEVADMIRTGDPAGVGVSSLVKMVQDGGADRIAKMMLSRKTLFPAFIDLLVHEKLDIRLGAMVAVETIAESDAGLAGQLVEPLWKKYPNHNDQVKGDILYVFGESGGETALPLIREAVDASGNLEIKEAGEEAAEKIGERINR